MNSSRLRVFASTMDCVHVRRWGIYETLHTNRERTKSRIPEGGETLCRRNVINSSAVFFEFSPLATSMATGSPGPTSGAAVVALIIGLCLRSFFWTPVDLPAPPPPEGVPAPAPCPVAEPCLCGPWTIAGVAVAAFAAGASLIGIAWAGCYLAVGFGSGLHSGARACPCMPAQSRATRWLPQ